ncbi:MAG TPA: MarR family transcriptional regulator [Bacteroidales bacterium]|nr:MAG: MarR family transcriptional regulator [Bacteroidetes bacterium GWF2_33_38]OFY75497.1 MAG: MarR family transcriptional regulator [Bacteroidetes bacterium RIFOXYA12_FULL_33_9]OFY85457.1 MAG: MarR family transcriptional regulator [Bacteroidetes bacterium RIFOXYA2_FULL_33_7]HBF87854.1 MarR family transcriptional regulator [Bacteroidales bacterium]
METSEKIIQAIKKAGKAMKSAEIADATGIDKKEVDKVLKKLKTEEKIISPKMCFYDVKK